MKDEFLRVMDIISIVFTSMGLENFEAQISLRDKENREKYIGSDENWEKAERAIVEACEEKGLKAKVEYGEAAFYGPKLDFMVKDASVVAGSWVPFRWTTTCRNASSWNTWAQITINIVPAEYSPCSVRFNGTFRGCAD